MGLTDALRPDAWFLACAFVIDLTIGDPVYRAHPIRMIGVTLGWTERMLRRLALDGYGGGIALFVLLAGGWLSIVGALVGVVSMTGAVPAGILHVAVLYTMLALGDLLHHVWRIEGAARADDVERARVAVSALVGRDTERMDLASCRRAGVESLSENLTDGFVSPVFWYVLLGLPGIVLFKIVSTMDSMVGYKTPSHLRFGWCGARLDDVMNFIPARLTWLMIAAMAALLPGLSGAKAWRVGLRQHGVLLGPNSGWSEAATAGALERRIVGPIWLRGVQVTDLWVGDPGDPPFATADDMSRALRLTVVVGTMVTLLAMIGIASMWR